MLKNTFSGIALGRKNWIFSGNHDAAEDAAAMF
jgi:hypothetical protein